MDSGYRGLEKNVLPSQQYFMTRASLSHPKLLSDKFSKASVVHWQTDIFVVDLVQPEEALEPTKQEGVVYKILCAKCILVKQGDQCEKGKKNTTETYGLLVLRPLWFQSMWTKWDIFLFGAS